MIARRDMNAPLNWFLAFVNAHLESMSTSERYKLQVDLAEALRIPIDFRGFVAPVNPEWTSLLIVEDVERLESLQRKFRETLDDIKTRSGNIRREYGDTTTGCLSPERYLELTRLAPVPLTIELALSIEPEELPDITPEGVKVNPFVPDKGAGPMFIGERLVVRASGGGAEALMWYHFLQALNGIRPRNLAKCPQCGNWFNRTSSRDRSFCSSICATRHANKERYRTLRETSLNMRSVDAKERKRRARKSEAGKQPRNLPSSRVEPTRGEE